MRKENQPDLELNCELCGNPFELGNQIFILHLWIIGLDICVECRNKIITFLEAFPAQQKNPSL